MKMEKNINIEDNFKKAMNEYINNINAVCDALLNHLNASENIDLRTKMDFFNYRAKNPKLEYEFDGTKYNFHGKGCTAFSDKIFLDWDFGYRSRWCGIDPWKAAISFLKSNSEFIEFYDGNLIKKICEQFIADGIMFSKQEQYYFTIPENQTFKPDFPKEFDSLIIEHNGLRCSIPRNKMIDRFVRKSNRIYNQIDKNKNCYFLKFLHNGRVVYAILYDDIGYPENAVKIMSDHILKNIIM